MLSCRHPEAPILSPSDRTALPTPSQLERTALSLERKGNLRLLVCVVEAWDEIGEPTRPALLAQIRALLELRVVDRAWARLQALLDESETADGGEAYRLAGGLLVDRGQHKEARALLTRARQRYPDDLVLRELLGRTHDPGTVLDVTDPLEDDPDGQTKVAERLLVEGAPLKARRILDRVRRANPDHTRASDLLWALDGDFRLRGVTLGDLVRVHAALPTVTADDEPEHTESAGRRALPLDPDTDTGRAFAGLFKNLDAETDAEGTTAPPGEPEVTHARAMEFVEELTDAGDDVTSAGREDTQIMHVVRADGALPDASTADTLVDRPYDLRDPVRPGTLDVDGETEDENVVVRRKIDPVDTEIESHTQGRIRLDPSRERVQPGVATSDEDAGFMRPRKRPEVVVEEVPRPAAASNRTPRPAGSSAPRKPRLTAAPAASATPVSPTAVTLEKKRTPPGAARRPRIDPALAAAPTLILEDADEPAPRRRRFDMRAVAPWTGWLLMLAFLGLLLVAVGGFVVLWQLVVVLS